MNCPNCQTENQDEALFCFNCGIKLQITCSNCGTVSPAGVKFCSNCGNNLAETPAEVPETASADRVDTTVGLDTQRQAPEQYMPPSLARKLEKERDRISLDGERRVVTVLFCDIVGSTAAARTLDPEEWTEIMNGAFEHLIRPVYKFEGTVARLMGDAILALFGAPIAHEDDPQRAILAGLDMVAGIEDYAAMIKQQWDVELSVRVGINTGLAVIGEVGSEQATEYTAMGDAVNLASRMEQTAKPGAVQITADTYRLIAPLVEVEDLGGIEIKGQPDPVPAYQVLGLKAEPGRLRGIEGLDAPLVGRDKEMHALRGAILELRQGRGQIISVMGEAGLGKSRLLAELRQAPAPIPDTKVPIRWAEGRSLSYQTNTAYAPFQLLLFSLFNLQEVWPEEEKKRRISEKIQALLPDREKELNPYIFKLMGYELTGEETEEIRYLQPPQLRERIFQAVLDTIEALAEVESLALVFDDVHWIDTNSLELLGRLLVLAERAAVLIVALFRPRKQEPSWQFHETAGRDFSHRYQAITLRPLDSRESRELVANLLHVEDLPEKVRGLILQKAEGNPFYVEEVIRSLLDAELVVRHEGHWQATKEIEDISVPDTLVGVITARLDRLEEPAKRVAQSAAVIGRQFELDTLAAVYGGADQLGGAITELQRRELIREIRRTPQPLYQFKHALTQETAYASLLKRTRQRLHLRTAEYLEEATDGQPGELARHFGEADEIQRALPYMVEAGDRAGQAYASADAIGFYSQALKILETEPNPALLKRTYEGLGSSRMLSGDMAGTIETYETMIKLGKAGPDVPLEVSGLNKLAMIVAHMQGNYDEAVQLLTESERLAKNVQDLGGMTELHVVRCSVCLSTGDFAGALNHFDESEKLGEKLNLEEPLLFGQVHKANALMSMTYYEEGWEKAQEARRSAESLGNQQYLTELLSSTYPDYYVHLGELEKAKQIALEGIALGEKIGAGFPAYWGIVRLIMISRWQGEYEQALNYSEQAANLGMAIIGPIFTLVPECADGGIYLEISEAFDELANESNNRALALLEMPNSRGLSSMAMTDIGLTKLKLGDIESADKLLHQALEASDGFKFFVRPMNLIGLSQLYLAQNKLQEAADYAVHARNFVDTREMRQFSPFVSMAEGEVGIAQGDQEAALESFKAAEALALEMNLRPIVWQSRLAQANIYDQAGQTAEADSRRQDALAVVEEIGLLFEDDTLRSQFRESAIEQINHRPAG